jgi:hypothetical protein
MSKRSLLVLFALLLALAAIGYVAGGVVWGNGR